MTERTANYLYLHGLAYIQLLARVARPSYSPRPNDHCANHYMLHPLVPKLLFLRVWARANRARTSKARPLLAPPPPPPPPVLPLLLRIYQPRRQDLSIDQNDVSWSGESKVRLNFRTCCCGYPSFDSFAAESEWGPQNMSTLGLDCSCNHSTGVDEIFGRLLFRCIGGEFSTVPYEEIRSPLASMGRNNLYYY